MPRFIYKTPSTKIRQKSLNHVNHLLLQLFALQLQMLHRLEEQLVAIPLARALNRKDEVVSPPAELDLALKLGMSQRLSADGVLHRVLYHGLDLAQVALIATAGLADIFPRHLVEANDALGEALLELFGVGAEDGAGDVDER